MDETVKVACVQAESVVFDRAATIEKIDGIAAEVAANGARLALFPEAFIPVYPSSRWARHLAGWDGDARPLYGRLARESLTIPGPDSDRLAEIARTRGLWLAVGANELERGTIYNSLLYLLARRRARASPPQARADESRAPRLGARRRDAGCEAIQTGFGRHRRSDLLGELMPLARFALYESGVEIYLASTADDSDDWQRLVAPHRARERARSCSAVRLPARVVAIPTTFRSRESRASSLGRGGSAILAPDGTYLAGPL